MTDWQDISTAPRDGTVILGFWGEFIFPVAWERWPGRVPLWGWRVARWEDFNFLLAVEPTHWMPMPLPPAPRAVLESE